MESTDCTALCLAAILPLNKRVDGWLDLVDLSAGQASDSCLLSYTSIPGGNSSVAAISCDGADATAWRVGDPPNASDPQVITDLMNLIVRWSQFRIRTSSNRESSTSRWCAPNRLSCGFFFFLILCSWRHSTAGRHVGRGRGRSPGFSCAHRVRDGVKESDRPSGGGRVAALVAAASGTHGTRSLVAAIGGVAIAAIGEVGIQPIGGVGSHVAAVSGLGRRTRGQGK